MKFSYAWIQEYVTKKLPAPDELAELLTMHSVEVEDVLKTKGGTLLDIDILPNRAHDMLGHIGIARECAALLHTSLKAPTTKPLDAVGTPPIKVSVQERYSCPRYMALVMDNISVGPSPKWLSSRLELLGLKSINNVVDAANYVMLESGQPLHAFDMHKLDGGITVRKAVGGEQITTLDGSKYTLDSSHLVIADSKDVLAIAGVKGGQKAEVTRNTNTIVLESANFDPIAVRRVSRDLSLHTDSSYRFEHGVPVSFPPIALARVTSLIGELAGGEQVGKIIDIASGKPRTTTLVLRASYTKSLLGVDIPLKKAQGILNSLEFTTEKKGSDALKVHVPSFRLDIEREEDLVEEVGRMYGYEQIKAQVPHGALSFPAEHDIRAWDRLAKRTLMGLGAYETYSLSFISEQEKNYWGYGGELVEVANPISSEARYMRPSLLPRLLVAGIGNINIGRSGLLFEVGHVFSSGRESERVGVIGFSSVRDPSLFYRVKGIAEGLFQGFRLADVWYDPKLTPQEKKDMAMFHPERRTLVKVGKELVGWIGEIHPDIVHASKGKGGYVAAEFDFVKLRELAEYEYIYQEPSKYPAVVRDISVVTPRQTHISTMMQIIHTAGGPLIQDIDLFDVYEANAAFHVIFQARDRTLSSHEVDEHMKKITRAFTKQGYEVR